MELLKGIEVNEMIEYNCVWNKLLESNFSDETAIKQFDSLISKSENPEKVFRFLICLMLGDTSSNEIAINFIKQKLQERLDFIKEELKRIKAFSAEENKVVVDIENSENTFYQNGKALELKFDALAAKFVLVLKKFNLTIDEESAQKFICDLEKNSLEGFVKPVLSLNTSLLGLISEESFAIKELKNFYNELEAVLIVRSKYRKEKNKRKNDYSIASRNCADYEFEEDKLRAERKVIKKLLKLLNEKSPNNSLLSNVDKIIANVERWFKDLNVDESIKNQINFLAKFQVDFVINDKGEIVIKELLINGKTKDSIISFEKPEDYILFRSLIERKKCNFIGEDDLDEEHKCDYIKETLICLVLHGFFVEKHRNIDFVDDVVPEFINDKLSEKLNRMASQTPLYVRSLQLLNTKAD